MIRNFTTDLFELSGEALVLLGERGDEEALLLLRLALLAAVLVELRLQRLQVLLQLAHLQVVLLLHRVQPPTQVVLLLLKLLQKKTEQVAKYVALLARSLRTGSGPFLKPV